MVLGEIQIGSQVVREHSDVRCDKISRSHCPEVLVVLVEAYN